MNENRPLHIKLDTAIGAGVLNSKIPTIALAAVIFVLCATLYLVDITSYGPTWDESLFHWDTGRKYYNFLVEGDTYVFEDSKVGWFPPIAPLIGYTLANLAFLCELLPNYYDRFHVTGVLFGAAIVTLVFLISARVFRHYGYAVFAALLLGSHPQFITHAHNNVRDTGLMLFYALTIWSALHIRDSKRPLVWCFATGLLTGITCDVKQNGVFLLPLVGLWLLRNHRVLGWTRFAIASLLFGSGAIAAWLAFWPYLWFDTIDHIFEIWSFLSDPGIVAGSTTFYDRVYVSMRDIPVFYAWVMLFLVSPPAYGVLAVFGLGRAAWLLMKANSELGLICLWLCVPLARFFYTPSAVEYDQIRHFLEVLPATAILAAAGLEMLKSRIPMYLSALVALAVFGYNTSVVLRYRPYGTAYFNFAAGPSSYVNHAFDVEFWGGCYREAVPELIARFGNAKYFTAGLGVHIFHAAGLPAESMTEDMGQPFDYAIFMNKTTTLRDNDYVLWLLENKKPLYTIEREGVVVFYAFRARREEYLATRAQQ